jgi:hypothetical protein
VLTPQYSSPIYDIVTIEVALIRNNVVDVLIRMIQRSSHPPGTIPPDLPPAAESAVDLG